MLDISGGRNSCLWGDAPFFPLLVAAQDSDLSYLILLPVFLCEENAIRNLTSKGNFLQVISKALA